MPALIDCFADDEQMLHPFSTAELAVRDGWLTFHSDWLKHMVICMVNPGNVPYTCLSDALPWAPLLHFIWHAAGCHITPCICPAVSVLATSDSIGIRVP